MDAKQMEEMLRLRKELDPEAPDAVMLSNSQAAALEGEKPFDEKLKALINEHCRESDSDTPDFILANYMMACLEAFEVATNDRDQWYRGKKNAISARD